MKVLVEITSNSLGDTIGAVAVISKYQKETGNNVSVICNYKNILNKSYPNLSLINRGEITDNYEKKIITTYKFDKPLLDGYSEDFGINSIGVVPKVDTVEGVRPVKNKYVCIGVHSTAQCKYWNYPDGWNILSKMLRKKGITPVVVERDELFGIPEKMNELPKNAVKKIGMPFNDVINYIQHCEFYIGISSGLSWVAQGLGKPTVIISNVTSKNNEFIDEKTLRIYDESVCHGCIHTHKFDPSDWLWCPLFRNDSSKIHLCTKSISPEKVMENIEKFFLI
jgi:autotransporter strand-loop-strand O-heptosyltransferase